MQPQNMQHQDSILYRVVATRTPRIQIRLCMAVMFDLSMALFHRFHGQISNVEEAIAEVKILLRQMELLFGQEKVQHHLESKLALLEKQLENTASQVTEKPKFRNSNR